MMQSVRRIVTFALLLVLTNQDEASLLPDVTLQQLITQQPHLLHLYAPLLSPARQLIHQVLDRSAELSQECANSLQAVVNGLDAHQTWALEYLDASGHGVAGKFAGYMHDFGNYDQCIQLRSPVQQNVTSFGGQYCAISILSSEYDMLSQNPKLDQSLDRLSSETKRWIQFNLGHIYGVCIPSTCDPNQLFNIVNQELQATNITVMVQRHCTKYNEPKYSFTFMDKFSMFLIAMSVVLVAVGTLLPIGSLKHFNLERNWHKLVKPIQESEAKRMQFLHGAKFLYIVLTLTAHCWFIFMPIFPLLFGGVKRYNIGHEILRQVSSSSLLLPDGMFFLSGILTIYTWFPIIEKMRGKLSFKVFAISRWIRTVPVLIGVLTLLHLSKNFGFGPFFKEIANQELDKCSKNFGLNLIFLSNWVRGLEMCMPQTWFISLDFQLYLFHYLTMILLYRRPAAGFALAAIQAIGTCSYIFWRTYLNGYPAYLKVNEANIVNLYDTEVQYLNTFLHSTPYTIGVLTGYLIRRKITVNFSSLWFLSAFVGAVASSLAALFIPYLFENGYLANNPILLAFWASIVRPMFVLGFSFALYVIYHHRLEWLAYFLRLHFMVPISRMGLSIVISQYLYIMYMLGSSRQMHLFTTFAQIKEGLAGLVIMLTIGLVIYLLFEAPVVNLLFDLVGSKRGQKEMVKPRKLRVDLAEFKDENGNLKPEYEKWSSCNGQSWSPCSPDIEQKQL